MNLEDKLLVYRGVSQKDFADQLKQGTIYIGRNINNVRGNGIYTTANIDCANHFAGSSGAVVNMILSKDANILEYSYLQDVLKSMCSKHPEEFNIINTSDKRDLTFDSVEDWMNEFLKDYLKDDYDEYVNGSLSDDKFIAALMEMKEHPDFQDVSKNRKYYFKDKEAAMFYNSGLLAKLLGYDVLRTNEFDEELTLDIQEYLVLDAKVLKVCN